MRPTFASRHGRRFNHQILAAAATGELILITADRGDFGRELALTISFPPVPPDIVRAADVAALLLADIVAAALDTGAFIVLTPSSVSVRHLPLR